MGDELHANTSTWTPADKKKLQHMTEFHQEYQHIFDEGASIQTIMKRRISHMNPPYAQISMWGRDAKHSLR